MQQIVNFIIRNKSFLSFFLLFLISFIFTIQSHSYHKSKYVNSTNVVTGGIYKSLNDFTLYLNLKSQNQVLASENKRLKSLLYNKKTKGLIFTDSTRFDSQYKFFAANAIRNSYAVKDNYILIDKGSKNGIKQDFAVITDRGILGIIDETSANYSTVISILNTNSRISAMLKKSQHFGTLTWNTKNPNIIQLIDIPKIAPVRWGDTIVTSGRSSIFPKNVPIGTVRHVRLDVSKNFYEIDIKLFNDMTSIEHVYIIDNKHSKEINTLLSPKLDE